MDAWHFMVEKYFRPAPRTIEECTVNICKAWSVECRKHMDGRPTSCQHSGTIQIAIVSGSRRSPQPLTETARTPGTDAGT